jgi:hypothetical protein
MWPSWGRDLLANNSSDTGETAGLPSHTFTQAYYRLHSGFASSRSPSVSLIKVYFSSPICAVFPTGPQRIPNRLLQGARSSSSTYKLKYLLSALTSSSGCLRFLPRLLISSTFPSINQFIRKVWSILSASVRFTCTIDKIFLFSFILCNTSSFHIRSALLIFSILLQHHISKISSVQVSALYKATLLFHWFLSQISFQFVGEYYIIMICVIYLHFSNLPATYLHTTCAPVSQLTYSPVSIHEYDFRIINCSTHNIHSLEAISYRRSSTRKRKYPVL